MRGRNKLLLTLFVLSLILWLGDCILRANEVPEKRTTLIFEPYYFHLGDMGSDNLYWVRLHHGYDITRYRQSSANNTPNVTLEIFKKEIRSGGYGIISIGSHGGEVLDTPGVHYYFTHHHIGPEDEGNRLT